MTGTYEFGYSEENVYGLALSLVREHRSDGAVHLDIGCGYGAIAEPARDAGMTYLGFDLDEDSVTSLRDRGFEAHVIDLSSARDAYESIVKYLDGRTVASVTALDVIEHLADADELLRALRDLCATHGPAPLVVSVPNVAHRDVAIKLLTNRWEYTPSGLLDRTHIKFFTEQTLKASMRSAGWTEISAKDFTLEFSDQHFPETSVVLSPTTEVGMFLNDVRSRAGYGATVNQFIRAYLPSRPREASLVQPGTDEDSPALTVLVRTQGRRPESLRDTLLALTAQSDQNFELVILAHKTTVAEQLSVEQAIAELDEDMRARTRLLVVQEGRRARPLNRGIEAARGDYITVLDDDDIVFAHWTETFLRLANLFPGRVLRTVAVSQQVTPSTWPNERKGFRTTGATKMDYPSQFDLLQHLVMNHSPFMTLAFPRELFRELGVRFNEELPVCEDWDLILRASLLCGVADTPEITAIYRRWQDGDASHLVHTTAEWRRAEAAIIAAIDDYPNLVPAGHIQRIRDLVSGTGADRVRALEKEITDLRAAAAAPSTETLELRSLAHWQRLRIEELQNSSSWRLTKPLRSASRAIRRARHLPVTDD